MLISILMSAITLPDKNRLKVFYYFLFCLSTLIGVLHLSADYFTGEGVNSSVIYHLRVGVEGAGFWEYRYLYLGLIFFLILNLLLVINRHKIKFLRKYSDPIFLLMIFFSIFYNPSLGYLKNIYNKNSIASLVPVKSFRDFYSVNVVAKSPVTKNLLYIYLESLERTYMNELIFPNLLRNIKKIEKKSNSFTNVMQLEGTGWTVGGMVASQCGVPLVSPSGGNDAGRIDGFLPKAICLGDILKNNGYDLSFIGGADLKFAGKGNFYRTHKFDNIYGVSELSQLLEVGDYKNNWGLYDDTIFSFIIKTLREKRNYKKPFAIFTLTLDTHHPNGHPSKSCRSIIYKNGKNPMLNSVACTDYLLDDLLEQIKREGLDENLTIVISSDHLAMKNGAHSFLSNAKRRNLFMILDPDYPPNLHSSSGSMLDAGATVLDFLGFEGDLGLGVSLIQGDSSNQKREFVALSLAQWRNDLMELWDFPVFEHFNIHGKDEAFLNDRKLKPPFIVHIDMKKQTSVTLNPSRQEFINKMMHIEKIQESFIAYGACSLLKNKRQYKKDKSSCLFVKKRGPKMKKHVLSAVTSIKFGSEGF